MAAQSQIGDRLLTVEAAAERMMPPLLTCAMSPLTRPGVGHHACTV
jgi:hypothetical protein